MYSQNDYNQSGARDPVLSESTTSDFNSMTNTRVNIHGLWGTFEALVTSQENDFLNPFDCDLWILVVELSHLAPEESINTIKIEGKYNLYYNIIASLPTSNLNNHKISNQIRVEAREHPFQSGINLNQYVLWRKDENLKINSQVGNFIRITGQLVRNNTIFAT